MSLSIRIHSVFYIIPQHNQDYLEYVIAESNKQGISDPGILVNLASYNDKEGGKATLFFSPTIGSSTIAHKYLASI